MIKVLLKQKLLVGIASLAMLFFLSFSAYAQLTRSLEIDTLSVSLKEFAQIEEVSATIDYQDLYFSENDKYIFSPKQTYFDISYETHEYITPSGQKGYQIFTETKTELTSIGYGVESESRTFIINKIADEKTSTSTTDIKR